MNQTNRLIFSMLVLLASNLGFCQKELTILLEVPKEKSLASINMLVNSLSMSPALKTWDENSIKNTPNGKASLTIAPPFSEFQINFFKTHNPYDCTTEKNEPMRSDWLTAFSFGRNYYEALGLDTGNNGQNAVGSLEKLLGLKFDFKSPVWKKALYRKGESRITRFRRSVMKAHSPNFNSDIWITIDQDLEDLGEAINPFQIQPEKRTKTVAAGEIIGTLPNGMPFYALITRSPDGNLILADAAPANLVTNNFPSLKAWKSSHFYSGQGENPSAIENAHQCLTCHREGLVGPQRGLEMKKADVESFLNTLAKSAKDPREAQQLKTEAQHLSFLSEEDYEKGTKENSANLLKTLKAAKAFIPDPKNSEANSPFVPDIVKAYNKSLTLDQIAKELGTSPLIAKEAVDQVDRKGGSVPIVLLGEPPNMARGIFEQSYCEIKSAVETIQGNKDVKRTLEKRHIKTHSQRDQE